jgi:hypothetical protein
MVFPLCFGAFRALSTCSLWPQKHPVNGIGAKAKNTRDLLIIKNNFVKSFSFPV